MFGDLILIFFEIFFPRKLRTFENVVYADIRGIFRSYIA